ncbi:MAG: hypothetical protein A3F13_00935 [Gammaproteobacteria bacterium RIFCSPHIGHO2_12_FULL_40_19]|nr:MAG: hypothetical protein A3F13_00935 [Gammaproteobacteria bacterium RIFCSPHIGHO2_12_FULL_40_19]
MRTDPLILIPGLLCDATVWEDQVSTLKTHTDILIPDLLTANTPTEMVAAVLNNAPPTFALAGHSMGGWVALEIMRVASTRVTKLCLLNTSASLDTPEKAATRQHFISLANDGEFETLIELLLNAFLYQTHCKAKVKNMLLKNHRALINQEKAMQQRKDCVPMLNTIQCPTLIIHSNQDAVFNLADSTLMQNHIPNATLIQINYCGHMSPMEAPNEVTQYLREWLFAKANAM